MGQPITSIRSFVMRESRTKSLRLSRDTASRRISLASPLHGTASLLIRLFTSPAICTVVGKTLGVLREIAFAAAAFAGNMFFIVLRFVVIAILM